MRIRSYEAGDLDQLVSLWHRCGLVQGAKDPVADIARKMRAQPDGLLVGEVDGRVVAAAMVGYDGHRGSINYVAVDPDVRHFGYGRLILQKAEDLLREQGCPKINLLVRKSNLSVVDFYKALGFEIDDVVSMGKRLTHTPAAEEFANGHA